MVFTFFRRGESGMEHIVGRIAGMLDDAHHAFEVATGAALLGSDLDDATADIARTDARINRTEHELRRELIVHVSVHGATDIGRVLGHTLLIKKVERIGDQAKNILDLANAGVSFVDAPDRAELLADRDRISELFDEVRSLIDDPTSVDVDGLRERASALEAHHAARMRELMHSDDPGRVAVPRAVLHRYLKRIVANLIGVALTVVDPIPAFDDED